MAQMTQIAWDGPHFGNPSTPPGVKVQETMSPLDEENLGHKMMENMGWENGTPLGCRNEGILNPPHIDATPKKNRHGVGYIAPLTEAQQRWNFNQLKENDRLQSAIEDYMLSNGPSITDEEKALLKDINDMEHLTAEIGDYDSALIGIDQDDMENFEDMCNMKEAFHWLLAKSPQDGGRYWKYTAHPTGPNGKLQMGWGWFIDIPNFNSIRRKQSKKGLVELDEKNRIMTDIRITNRGTNYIQGICEYGKVYIDLKFTKYVPMVGGKVTCVIGLNGKGSHPWKVYRVPR